MEKALLDLNFKDNLSDTCGNRLNSHTLASILTYLYGDKRTTRQISKYLNIHQMKIILYLDYLLKEKLIAYIEEDTNDMIEKYYYIEKEKPSLTIKTDLTEQSSILAAANDMGNKIRDIVMNLDKESVNDVSYYIGKLSKKNAEYIVSELKRLYDKVEELEDDTDDKEYILMTAFSPYIAENLSK